MKILAGFLLLGSLLLSQSTADPNVLFERARDAVLQPGGRSEAEALLRQATSIWEKKQSKSSDYATALDLLVMTIYPAFAKNKDALNTQVEPLARKAMDLRQSDPESKPADLALSLELEAMVLEAAGRLEDSRDPKGKARGLRDQIIIAMQPPAEEATRNVSHMGNPGVRPPMLLARAEPVLTFEARVLGLKPDVLAEVIIGSDGMVHNVEIFRPAGFGLDESAVAAIMKWRFKAAEKDGSPVAVEGNLRLRFQP